MAAKKKEEDETVPDAGVELYNAMAALGEYRDNKATIKVIDEAVKMARIQATDAQVIVLACLRNTTCSDLLTTYEVRMKLSEIINLINARYAELRNTTEGHKALANAYNTVCQQ